MKLEVKDLSFQYKSGAKILDNLSFTIEKGERVGVTAPSGAGKTTLCSIIGGYRKPTSGTILLDGVDIHKQKRKGPNPIQMIWQHPEKSVDPNLKMKDTMAEAADLEGRIYDGIGIEKDWFNRYPAELSGGEIQRFCIARALMPTTRFLIADEISTMLDLVTQAQIWGFLLQEIKEREIGLLAVTHSDSLMDYVAERTISL